MKINLGCGSDVKPGYENYDKFPVDNRVKFIDLNKLPLPFENNSIDEVYLSHVLEHLSCDKYLFILDVNRILKPGGNIIVKLPIWESSIGHTSFYHSSSYFDGICTEYKTKNFGNPNYANKIFSLVYLRKNRWLFKSGIEKLVAFLIGILYAEYEWCLKKENRKENDL